MKLENLVSPILALLSAILPAVGMAEIDFTRYHNPSEIIGELERISAMYPQVTRIHSIAESPGGLPVVILEIGPEVQIKEKTLPAVFVVADLEATTPIASEAALFLISQIVADPDTRADKSWYVSACSNPDAASRFFEQPKFKDSRNSLPHNDDMDDRVDEDGTDDLNGDGFITQMRVKEPNGEWVIVESEPRLMRKADAVKGEKGVYTLYTEGLDNDEDGAYNEDGVGGVNPGINFPHLFKPHTVDGGAWPGSTEETFQLMKFFSEHPEIGMTFALGQTNFFLVPPQGGRKGSVDLTQIKIPERIGRRLGIDTDRTYSLEEIKEMMEPFLPPGMELTEAMIASYLGLGAVVNPLPEDLKFYEELSRQYKEFLKERSLDGERLEPEKAKDGSFELWAYYHLGLPSFSLDFWALPKIEEEKKPDNDEITPEKLEGMTNEEFIALGEERIDEFLKSVGSPGNFTAKQVIGALQGGMMNTKRMATMLRERAKKGEDNGGDPKTKALLAFSDTNLSGGGFVPWEVFDHPTLGEVEIGGAVSFTDSTPPEDRIEPLLSGQVPWIFRVVDNMARIRIAETRVESLGSGLSRVEVWVENTSLLPYPTAMGKRNSRIGPVILTLDGEGIELVEGKPRSLIKEIAGHGTEKIGWLVRTLQPVSAEVKVETPNAWRDSATIQLGGAQ